MPDDASIFRKNTPVFSGFLAYFPLAVEEVARLSKAGNDKHNPGEPLHWSKGKSNDHADCLARHLLEHDKLDDDGFRHDVKVAWRAMALLQTRLENERVGGVRADEITMDDIVEARNAIQENEVPQYNRIIERADGTFFMDPLHVSDITWADKDQIINGGFGEAPDQYVEDPE